MTSGAFGEGLFGLHAMGAGPAGPGPPAPVVSRIRFVVEAAFGSYPSDETYTWTQIHDSNDGDHGYVRAIAWQRGLNDLLSRTETGTGTIVLKNAGMYTASKNRAWDPENAASPFYPHVKPGLPFRVRGYIDTTEFPVFQHFGDSFPQTRFKGNTYGEVTMPTVDAFARLALASPSPDFASLTVDSPGANNTIVFTAVRPGMNEENVTIRMYGAPHPLRVSVKGTDIEVRMHIAGLGGNPSNTAQQIIDAVNASQSASQLVVATNGDSSDGTGTIDTDFNKTPLAGGDAAFFPQELAGARINRALDQAGWPAALRDIADGTVQVAAAPFSSNEQGRLLSHVLDVAGEPGEFALVFVNGAGECEFLDTNSLYSNADQANYDATFSDRHSDGFLTYVDSEPNTDREHVINEWVGNREGGVAIIVRDELSIAQSLGRVSHSVSSLRTTDRKVQAALEFGRDEYGQPIQRISSLVVMPGTTTALWTACMTLDVGSRIRVLTHPAGGGAAIDKVYLVTRVAAQLGPGPVVSARYTYGLTPVRVTNYFVWDDATYGSLATSAFTYN